MQSMQSSPYISLGLFATTYCFTRGSYYSHCFWKEREGLPSVLYHEGGPASDIVSKSKDILLEYKASWLLGVFDFFGELQTAWTLYIRKVFPRKVDYKRELFVLKDGGTVAVDWLDNDQMKNDAHRPIVVLQHGLCGHTYSHYMKGIPEELIKNGFYVVSFVARGCGGIPLTTPETFTAARTADFRAVIQHIQAQYPTRKLCAVGYSLGAGLLLKYLGEEAGSCPLTSAVVISPAYDFMKRSPKFAQYERAGMVQGLIALVKKHESFLKNHKDSMLQWDGMINSKTIRDFDQAAILTGRSSDRDFLHFASVDEYYAASSAKFFSHLIEVPTLSISAVDDFLSCSDSVPDDLAQVGPGLVLLKTPHGGHVSFSDLVWSSHGPHSTWSDRAAAQWLRASCFKEEEE
eukprot:GSChrysophyteH1.ASY1.ANO1.2338.1 assembled CDS